MSLSNDRRNQILKIPIPKSTELSKLRKALPLRKTFTYKYIQRIIKLE